MNTLAKADCAEPPGKTERERCQDGIAGRAHQGSGPPCRGKHQGSRHQQAGHKDEGEPNVLPFPARFVFHRCCKEAVAQPGHHRERDSHHDHGQLLIKNRLTSHPTMSNMSRTNVYTTCSTAKLSM